MKYILIVIADESDLCIGPFDSELEAKTYAGLNFPQDSTHCAIYQMESPMSNHAQFFDEAAISMFGKLPIN